MKLIMDKYKTFYGTLFIIIILSNSVFVCAAHGSQVGDNSDTNTSGDGTSTIELWTSSTSSKGRTHPTKLPEGEAPEATEGTPSGAGGETTPVGGTSPTGGGASPETGGTPPAAVPAPTPGGGTPPAGSGTAPGEGPAPGGGPSGGGTPPAGSGTAPGEGIPSAGSGTAPAPASGGGTPPAATPGGGAPPAGDGTISEDSILAYVIFSKSPSTTTVNRPQVKGLMTFYRNNGNTIVTGNIGAKLNRISGNYSFVIQDVNGVVFYDCTGRVNPLFIGESSLFSFTWSLIEMSGPKSAVGKHFVISESGGTLVNGVITEEYDLKAGV